jgi:hypothetical protein
MKHSDFKWEGVNVVLPCALMTITFGPDSVRDTSAYVQEFPRPTNLFLGLQLLILHLVWKSPPTSHVGKLQWVAVLSRASIAWPHKHSFPTLHNEGGYVPAVTTI